MTFCEWACIPVGGTIAVQQKQALSRFPSVTPRKIAEDCGRLIQIKRDSRVPCPQFSRIPAKRIPQKSGEGKWMNGYQSKQRPRTQHTFLFTPHQGGGKFKRRGGPFLTRVPLRAGGQRQSDLWGVVTLFCRRQQPIGCNCLHHQQMAYLRKYKNGYRAEVEKRGIRESRVFETKRLAQEWANRRELEITSSSKVSTAGFFDTCDRYLREVSSGKDGEKWEKLRIEAFKSHFGDKPLSELRQPQMAAWRDARLKEVTGGTVRREKTLLNHIFTVARQEWHACDHKPFEGVKMPPDNEAREQVWRWQQIKRVLRAPATGKTKEVQDAFHIALRTAMRLQEVLAAPGLFDKERQVVKLPPELDKMGRRREIPIGRIAAKLLDRPAFVVEPNEASTLFADLLGCLGIKGMMFRDSRATALTLLARKVDVMRLQKISGHKDVRMLSRYYRENASDISKLI